MDQQLFHEVCDKVIGQGQSLMGIGTLGEKTVHSVLKIIMTPMITTMRLKLMAL